MATEIAAEKLAELKALGGNELIAKLLGKFVENSGKLLAEGLAAAAGGDATKVDYCVHTLKGSALSLGLTDMGNLLVALNVRTKAKDISTAEADLKKLQTMLADVAAYKQQNFPG